LRRANLAIAFVLLAALAGARTLAQESSGAKAQESGERVSLRDGRVSFVPPAGFKPMSKEDIAIKFGRNGAANAPAFVYSNEQQNVSVAIGFKGSGFQPEDLDELKPALETHLEKTVPRLEWIERGIITRNGKSWIRLYSKTAAIDTGIVNDMYLTIFDGQLVMFNFNSTVAQYEKHKESLRKSAQTITVK